MVFFESLLSEYSSLFQSKIMLFFLHTMEYLNMVITQFYGVFHSTMILLCWRNTEIVGFCVVSLICVCVLTGIGTSSCCVGSTVFLSNSFMMVLLNYCYIIMCLSQGYFDRGSHKNSQKTEDIVNDAYTTVQKFGVVNFFFFLEKFLILTFLYIYIIN